MHRYDRPPKPRWGWLYAMVTALIGLLGLIESAVPDDPARRVLEVVMAILIFVAMGLWVRASRMALWRSGECPPAERHRREGARRLQYVSAREIAAGPIRAVTERRAGAVNGGSRG